MAVGEARLVCCCDGDRGLHAGFLADRFADRFAFSVALA